MEPVVILVTELEDRAIDIDELDLVSGTKTHVCAFAGVDISNDRLHERPQISRSTMMDFEHNGSVAVVLNCHPFSEIVCRSHLQRN
jgi:hypothetical protein